jgi:hypothetical protein
MIKAEGVVGPKLDATVEMDLPRCVRLASQEDMQEFQDFIAAIIKAARTVWENERNK